VAGIIRQRRIYCQNADSDSPLSVELAIIPGANGQAFCFIASKQVHERKHKSGQVRRWAGLPQNRDAEIHH
jgi:hypothetical protein